MSSTTVKNMTVLSNIHRELMVYKLTMFSLNVYNAFILLCFILVQIKANSAHL